MQGFIIYGAMCVLRTTITTAACGSEYFDKVIRGLRITHHRRNIGGELDALDVFRAWPDTASAACSASSAGWMGLQQACSRK